MSKFPGGIFSKSSGKVSGLVFSEARTRTGKVMTARELVIPTNPQTDVQQANRAAQALVTTAVKLYGPGVYRDDWDNAVGQNAGWASMISVLRQAMKGEVVPSFGSLGVVQGAPSQVDLGDLHPPDTVSAVHDGGGDFTVSWSTENGANGSTSDQVVAFALRGAATGNALPNVVADLNTSETRSSGSAALSTNSQSTAGPYMVLIGLYLRSTNPVPENLSLVKWALVPQP